MVSLRSEIFKFMTDHPRSKPRQVIEKFPGENQGSIRTYIKQWKKSYNGNIPKKKVISPSPKNQGHDFIPPQNNMTYTDDPDELLMSVAVRELNRPNPDPRWATILINCKKENISYKNEVIEQLQKLPTKNLVEMLKKQSGKS